MILLVASLLFLASQTGAASVVLVRFTSATQHWQTCGVREQAWGGPATLLSHSGRWAQPFTGCYNDSLPDVANKAELAGRVALFQRGNCTFSTKVEQVGQVATAVLIVSIDDGLTTPIAVNNSMYTGYDLPVFMIQAQKDELNWTLITPFNITLLPQTTSVLDPNMVFFLLIAIAVIAAGSWWSTASLRLKLTPGTTPSAVRRTVDADDEEMLDFTWQAVLVFLGLACAVLLLLYFFYKYLVYLLMAFFVLGTASAWTTIALRWLPLSSNSCLQQMFHLPCQLIISGQEMVVWLCAMGCALTWFGLRHQPYAWVLQDILGIGLMVNALRLIRIPSLKVVTIILVLFPIYDVFFVFVTPHLTKHHDSVMVKAATGGGSKEQIPLALVMPRFHTDYCYQGQSLLGFGDLMIPGLCVAYALLFDCLRLTHTKTFRTAPSALHLLFATRYFPVTLVAYLGGLCITYGAMAAMQSPQPALLYLGPSLLLAFYSCAWYYNEVGACWRGSMLAPTPPETPSDTVQASEAVGNDSDDDLSDRAPLLGASDA